MYNHLWAVDKEGSYYTLKNGHTTEASYLQTPANSTTGESVFTASSKGSTANWILEPYTGDPLQAANFTTYTSNMIVGEEFTFHARMYSSSIGVNGPVQYLVLNADGTATDKATINRSTGKIQALKPGEIRVGATFSGTTTYWYRTVTIEESLEGTYFIKNSATGTFLMPNNNIPFEQSMHLELRDLYHNNNQEWNLIYVSEGYYKIQNQNTGKYVTSPISSTSGENITMEDELTDDISRQRWRFIKDDSGKYSIRAQNRNTYVISARTNSSSEGVNVQQQSPDNGDITKWVMAETEGFLYYGVENRTINLRLIGTTSKNSTWRPLIEDGVDAWNQSDAGTSITLTDTGTSSIVIEVESKTETWYGLCSQTYNPLNDITFAATITINSRTAISDNPRRSTITHEIGHLMWLDDNLRNDSIMSHNRNREVMLVPQNYDIYNVKFRYD